MTISTLFIIILGIIILGFTPGIFWVWYFYREDRWEPEPKKMIAKVFLYGIIISLPVLLLEAPFLFSELLLAIIAAPIIEEVFKFVTVRYSVYKNREFSEPLDGIIYASAVALGFASIENTFYLFSLLNKGVVALTAFFIVRAVLSVPGHALFSSMWGYALGVAKYLPESRKGHIVLSGLVTAISFHSLYNFLLSGLLIGAVGMLIFIPLLWKLVHNRIRELTNKPPFVPGKREGGDAQ
jgi:RsiW-degrading membrane proteinase PrsW (M82 family)